jgi:hypothetical protein
MVVIPKYPSKEASMPWKEILIITASILITVARELKK